MTVNNSATTFLANGGLYQIGDTLTIGNLSVSNNVTSSLTLEGSGDLIVGGLLTVGEKANNTASLIVESQHILQTQSAAVLGLEAGSSGSVLLDGGSWINNGPLLTVGDEGNGVITINNSGSLTSGSIDIGQKAGSTGSVLVDGVGSLLHSTGDMHVAGSISSASNPGGSGTLTITNGGQVIVDNELTVWTGGEVNVAGDMVIDAASSTSGSLNVSGFAKVNGGTLNTDSNLFVGRDSDGRLTVVNGGSVVVGSTLNLANLNGTTAAVIVDGAGSSLVTNGVFRTGQGTALLNIINGGRMQSMDTNIGFLATGTGIVNVAGAGSELVSTRILNVGYSGVGDLNIKNNGSVSSVLTYVGRIAGSSGTVDVSNGGSWTNTNGLFLGGSSSGGSGVLTVDTGGRVDVASVLQVLNTDSSVNLAGGTITATAFDNSGVVNIGIGGLLDVAGLLQVSNTGTVNLAGGTITATDFVSIAGGFNFTDGTLAVDGGSYDDGNTDLIVDNTTAGTNPTLVLSNGATANYSGDDLWVGRLGTGTLNINSGSTVTSQRSYISGTSGSDGTVTVSGIGTSFTTSSNQLVVGYQGTGRLAIDGNAVVNSNGGTLGLFSGSSGTVTVSGTGSSFTSSAALTVGLEGTGSLAIDGNAVVNSAKGVLGDYYDSSGTVTVSGPGSSWNITNAIIVGNRGNGDLTIDNNGLVSNMTSFVGRNLDSNGTVNVSSGGRWANAGGLFVGGDTFAEAGDAGDAGGTGVVNIGIGGLLDVAGLLKISSTGTVNLAGGTITTTDFDDSSGSFNFTAGHLNIGNDLTTEAFSSLALTSRHTLSVGGTTTLGGFATLSLNDSTFSTGTLVDNGGFSFTSGTFNLTGDDLAVGTGGLFGPTLAVSPNQTINVTNTTTVDNNGLLYVNGGSFNSGNIVNNGQVVLDGLISKLGGALSNNGLLNGNGRVNAVLTNNTSGEVEVSSGNTLHFTAAGNSNAGNVNLTGGTARFDQDLTNSVGGTINGRGVLIADGGLSNAGSINLSSGNTDIFGDVNNDTGGVIIASGNSTVTFFDDLTHNGDEIRVTQGSSLVVFGAASGAGPYTGQGDLFFEGTVLPGNSPGLLTVEGNLSLGLNSYTLMEIGGLAIGSEYDAFDVGGTLTLGGELEAQLFDLGSGLFDPQLGNSFDLFAAETIMGDFDLLTLAALGGGLDWQVDLLADAIGSTDIYRLSVVASTVPVPPAVWLFCSGLLGMVAVSRRRRVA